MGVLCYWFLSIFWYSLGFPGLEKEKNKKDFDLNFEEIEDIKEEQLIQSFSELFHQMTETNKRFFKTQMDFF
jgi:hypothetical protein